MIIKTSQTIVAITNPYFAKGYRLGRIWFFHGEPELPIDATYVVENVANYCENGVHHNPAWLSERVGFLMGMVSGQFIPEEG